MASKIYFKKSLKKVLNIESDEIAMKYLFDETKKEKIKYLFDNYSEQIYCLEILNNKFFSPSLLICLNYILENYNEDYVRFYKYHNGKRKQLVEYEIREKYW